MKPKVDMSKLPGRLPMVAVKVGSGLDGWRLSSGESPAMHWHDQRVHHDRQQPQQLLKAQKERMVEQQTINQQHNLMNHDLLQ